MLPAVQAIVSLLIVVLVNAFRVDVVPRIVALGLWTNRSKEIERTESVIALGLATEELCGKANSPLLGPITYTLPSGGLDGWTPTLRDGGKRDVEKFGDSRLASCG